MTAGGFVLEKQRLWKQMVGHYYLVSAVDTRSGRRFEEIGPNIRIALRRLERSILMSAENKD